MMPRLPRWTPEKSGAQLVLGLALAAFAAAYLSASAELHPALPALALASRAAALAAFTLLPLYLSVEPLAGLHPWLSPLRSLRAPCGAFLAAAALLHGVVAFQAHVGGARLGLLSLLASGADWRSLSGWPFQLFGALALLALAAPLTSRLGAPARRLALGYAAYALALAHLVWGPWQGDTAPLLRPLAWGGSLFLLAVLVLSRVLGRPGPAPAVQQDAPLGVEDELLPVDALPATLSTAQLGFLRSLGVLGVGLAYALGQAAAQAQGPVETGSRGLQTVELEGVLETSPLPLLRLPNGEALPLLGAGKRGAPVPATGDDRAPGRQVRVRGHVLERKGWRWLAVDSGGLRDQGEARHATRRWIRRGSSRLQGEIVEPACYFGARWPSEGRLHRACADLGIHSGQPPVLRVRHADGGEDYYLLLGNDGKPASEGMAGLAGGAVELEGEEEEVDGWRVIRLSGVEAVAKR